MDRINRTFTLNAEACDEISEIITDFCNEVGTDRKDMLRYRLSAEECILHWLENGCGGNHVRIRAGRFLRSPYFCIEADGEQSDPYVNSRKEGGFAENILVSLDLSPEYSYKNGNNRVYFRLKKKSMGPLQTLGIVIIAAIIVSAAGILVFPDGLREGLLAWLITPLYSTFFKLLSCIAGPMIFMSVTWGIYGIGDASTFSKVGKRLIGAFQALVFLWTAIAMLSFPVLGPGISHSGAGGDQATQIIDMILNIFPSTIIEPFETGNTLQIIFLAVVTGIALLFLGQSAESVSKAVEQLNTMVQFIMGFISKLIPYVIFLVIVDIAWSEGISSIISVWKLVAVFIPSAFILTAAFLILTAMRVRISPSKLFRNYLTSFIIALTTASSAAAFSKAVEESDSIGVDPYLSRFGVPMGMVMQKPLTAVSYLMIVFFFADKYGVSCSVGWLITAYIISALLATATPPVPGGAAISYSMLLSQMGIPSEALAIVLAIDLFLDFVITGLEVLDRNLTMVNVSAGLDLLDEKKLRS